MKIVADNTVPYLKGIAEPIAEVKYLTSKEFTPENVKDADILIVRSIDKCTRELLEGQLTAMYNYMKGDLQTYWYQLTTLAEARADNAYGGNMAETKVVSVESNHIDSDNEFASNLWNYSMNAVDYANQVICNIDLVKENDPSLTDKEYQEWLSEALCWRAYILSLIHI